MKTKRVTNNSLENCNKKEQTRLQKDIRKTLPVLNCKFNSSANLRLRNLLLVQQKNSCYNEGLKKLTFNLRLLQLILVQNLQKILTRFKCHLSRTFVLKTDFCSLYFSLDSPPAQNWLVFRCYIYSGRKTLSLYLSVKTNKK